MTTSLRSRWRAFRATALTLLAAALVAPAEAAGPNVIVIVADDVSWHDLHVQGAQDLSTPAIDSLATGGVNFRNAYASAPVCSPSRAGLLTGRWQQRFGHETNPGESLEENAAFGLPLTESTMGDRMRALGYATAWIGKSHLGAAESPGAISVYHPLNRGFDRFFGFLGSHRRYDDPEPAHPIWDDAETIVEPEYLTAAFAREINAFIDHQVDNAPEQPFFVYAPFSAAHFDTDRRLTYPAEYAMALPDELFTSGMRRDFARVLLALDDAVAAILAKIVERGIASDTLVIFTSDNGGDDLFGGINLPLAGRKTELYEGGVRVPFLMRWPGHLPAGVTRDGLVSLLDILPTAVAAAGAPVPAAWQLDGVNLLPYARGETAASPHDALYWRMETNGVNESQFGVKDGLRAIRQGEWKLLKPSIDAPWKLYDLATDEAETTDLAGARPDKVAELIALWEQWNAGLERPLWAVDNLEWAAPGFVRDDILIGDPAVSYQDPEFHPDRAEASFQDASRTLWRGAVDPDHGWFVSGSGQDTQVDTGLAPLALSVTGARWGLSAAGAALYYTKGGNTTPLEVWRAGPGATPPGVLAALPGADISAPRISQDASRPASRLLVKAHPQTLSPSAVWATESSPSAVAALPFHAGGERNGVWIPGTTDIVYAGYPDGVAGTPQILRYDTSTGTVTTISTDAGAKSEVCAFFAPELSGELCYAAVVGRTSVAVYGERHVQPGGGRGRVATLSLPSGAPVAYFYYLKPLTDGRGWNGTSWLTVSAFEHNDPLAPGTTAVLLLELGPDSNHRIVRQLDAAPDGITFDAGTFAGRREVFCWYSNASGPDLVKLRRARTGLWRPDYPDDPSGFTRLEAAEEFHAGPAAGLAEPCRATETTALLGHRGKLFAALGSTGRLPSDGPGVWSGAQILRKDGPGGPWILDGNFPGHLTVAALASVPFTVDSDHVPLAEPGPLLLASLQDFSVIGSTKISVRTRIGEGNWNDSHIANPSGDASYPTAFGGHQRTVGGIVTEWAFAGLSSGRIHRGSLVGLPDVLGWETAAELSGTGPVRGFARAEGRLYASCSLRQDSATDPVRGGLYVRDDLGSSWSLVYQWTAPAAVFAADPGNLEMLGLTTVPDPRGGPHEMLLGARTWTGAVERIDPSADHAVTVELDVRDFLARRWHDESIRSAAVKIAFTGFAPAGDPVTGEAVHLAGLRLERPGLTTPAWLIRHHDGTWEDATLTLSRGMVSDAEAAIRSIAASPFPGESAIYFGGAEPPDGALDTAWISRGNWTAWPTLTMLHSSADTYEFAWPATSAEWVLNSSPDLLPGNWTPLPGLATRSPSGNSQALTLPATRQFFRLEKP